LNCQMILISMNILNTVLRLCRTIKSMPEHMSVAGAITIIVIEPVLVCIVPLLMLMLCDFKISFNVLSKR